MLNKCLLKARQFGWLVIRRSNGFMMVKKINGKTCYLTFTGKNKISLNANSVRTIALNKNSFMVPSYTVFRTTTSFDTQHKVVEMMRWTGLWNHLSDKRPFIINKNYTGNRTKRFIKNKEKEMYEG
jgi:hypothetical protein